MEYISLFFEAVGFATTFSVVVLGLLVLSGTVKVGIKKVEDDDE